MRVFVAVDLSDAGRRAVEAEQQRMAAALGESAASVRWVRPERLHVTLVFLGEVDAVLLPELVAAVSRRVDLPPFQVVLAGTGLFPARGVPRAIWIGVRGAELEALQTAMTDRVAGLGIPTEERPFHPHLTLGRWRAARAPERARVLAAARPDVVARIGIDHATLYRSDFSSDQGAGPTYVALARANLTGVDR